MVPSPDDLDDDENWTGGFYGLDIELGPRDDSRLEQALLAIWRDASIDGCVADVRSTLEVAQGRPHRHAVVPLTSRSLERHGHLRGTVRLPGGSETVCGAVAVREDGGTDWLDFYIPMGALVRTDPVIGGFPFGEDGGHASLAWRRALDDWLAAVGSRVFAEVPFRLGLVGFEASGRVHADELVDGAPSDRLFGYLIPLAGGLEYHEANL